MIKVMSQIFVVTTVQIVAGKKKHTTGHIILMIIISCSRISIFAWYIFIVLLYCWATWEDSALARVLLLYVK